MWRIIRRFETQISVPEVLLMEALTRVLRQHKEFLRSVDEVFA